MSLEHYRRTKVLVLRPGSTAHEAARAMAHEGVGSVIVAEDSSIIGVLTDRDLALEIVAGDLDGRATSLHDIMSDEVASLDIHAPVGDVVQTMIEHACRRVPLLEGGRPVGIVTLDDLLADELIDIPTAAAIVNAQVERTGVEREKEGRAGPLRRARSLSRRTARAETAYHRLLRAVELHSGPLPRDKEELALHIVLGALCRRVTPLEARHLIAQLPSRLHATLEKALDGPNKRITTETIERELEQKLGVSRDVASLLLSAICEAIADSVSAGEIEAFRGQLPREMKDLFPPTPLRRVG